MKMQSWRPLTTRYLRGLIDICGLPGPGGWLNSPRQQKKGDSCPLGIFWVGRYIQLDRISLTPRNVRKMCKFYVLALFLIQWDMISRITKKKSWQNVNFTKDCGAKAVFTAKKKIHNPQHISWFFTASDDFFWRFPTNRNNSVAAEKHLGAS